MFIFYHTTFCNHFENETASAAIATFMTGLQQHETLP
jgi:hypothetical protein